MRHPARIRSRGYQKDPPAFAHPCILVGAGEMLTPEFTKKYSVTHVINCAYEEDSPSWFKTEYPDKYKCLNAHDSVDVSILDWYPEFRETITRFLHDPLCVRVFVHCQCGINRSAYLSLTYVSDVFAFPIEECMNSMIHQRPCALTNPAFREQVLEYITKKPHTK